MNSGGTGSSGSGTEASTSNSTPENNAPAPDPMSMGSTDPMSTGSSGSTPDYNTDPDAYNAMMSAGSTSPETSAPGDNMNPTDMSAGSTPNTTSNPAGTNDPAMSMTDSGMGGEPNYGGSSTYPGMEPNSGKPQTYAEAAAREFREGKDDAAFQFIYAHVLTDDQGAQDQKMYFVTGLNKPTMAVRWGVGVVLTPRDYKKAPPRIGDKPLILGRDGGTGGDASGGNTGTAPPSDPKQLLRYCTGDLGDKLLERLDMRRTHEDGYYGAVLKEAPGGWVVENKTGDGMGGSAPSISTSGSEMAGGYNPSGYGIAGGAPEQLIPGVTMVGLGAVKDLLERANQRNLDLLIVFDVDVTRLRTGTERNETTVSIYLVGSGKQIRSAKPTNNIKVYTDRQDLRDKSKDPVELIIDDLLVGFADEHFKAQVLPDLKPDQALHRVSSLVASAYENPLPVLAEIRYYHTHKLITDDELKGAYQKLIGDEAGEKLATGSTEEKKQAIAKWLTSKAIEAPTREFR